MKSPRLDFNKDNFPIVCCNDVNFAVLPYPIAFKNMIVAQQQIKQGLGFTFSAQVIVLCHDKSVP